MIKHIATTSPLRTIPVFLFVWPFLNCAFKKIHQPFLHVHVLRSQSTVRILMQTSFGFMCRSEFFQWNSISFKSLPNRKSDSNGILEGHHPLFWIKAHGVDLTGMTSDEQDTRPKISFSRNCAWRHSLWIKECVEGCTFNHQYTFKVQPLLCLLQFTLLNRYSLS